MSFQHSFTYAEDKTPSIPTRNLINAEFEASLRECSSFTRTTIGKRMLTYILKVLQQPVSARAPGSGSKKSPYRRLVDPPPVVSLVIFELKLGVQTNITFTYDASFFMFATLEVAPAHPHNSQTTQCHIPQYSALTGCPVSSANYLDLPHPAIFFVFPDLLIRHAGKYKLCFNLYENIKHFDDQDESRADLGSVLEAESYWRLELKSTTFTVPSAERFPGLAESTSLSRIIAEQGCRMRVRRAVRLRGPTIKDEDSPLGQNSKPRSPSFPVVPEENSLDGSMTPSIKGNMEPFKLRREDSSRDAGSKLPQLSHTASAYNLGLAPPQMLAIGGWSPQASLMLPRLLGSTDNRDPTAPQSLTAQQWSSKVFPEEKFLLDLRRYATGEERQHGYEQAITNAKAQMPDSPEIAGKFPNAGASLTSTSQLNSDHSTGETQHHIPEDAEGELSPPVSKEAIWSALMKCLPPEAGAPYFEISASEVSITPVNSEPQSHAIKRASQEWWLAHPSDAGESILAHDDLFKFVHEKDLKYLQLLRRIFSQWHQDLVASLRGFRNSGGRMTPLGIASNEEERVFEQLVHDIFQHLDRRKASPVKRAPAESPTQNAISGPGTLASHSIYQTSLITGKRRGRDGTASSDDSMGNDDPNQNNGTKRTKMSADQYNRYVICTQFAAGQDPACSNCFFGAWPSVGRLKQDHLVKVHKIDVRLMNVGKGGTESEKWWRLFDELHPGFREINPEVFIPGPFWEDRVAHNTYNKVFSEAMKRVERIRQRSTQILTSEIGDLLNRHRDAERQEIRQVVVDILHSRTRDSVSNESSSTVESMALEYASNGSLFTSFPTHSQKLSSESASSSTPVESSLPASPRTGPGHTSAFAEQAPNDHFSSLPNQTIPSPWQLTYENLGMSTYPTYVSTTPLMSDMLGIHPRGSIALTASSSETLSGTVPTANDFDIEKNFGKVCRCRFHSAECDKGVRDGNEGCTCCSGWFPWSAFAEPFLSH